MVFAIPNIITKLVPSKLWRRETDDDYDNDTALFDDRRNLPIDKKKREREKLMIVFFFLLIIGSELVAIYNYALVSYLHITHIVVTYIIVLIFIPEKKEITIQ